MTKKRQNYVGNNDVITKYCRNFPGNIWSVGFRWKLGPETAITWEKWSSERRESSLNPKFQIQRVFDDGRKDKKGDS